MDNNVTIEKIEFINFRVPVPLKRELEERAKAVGLDVSGFVRAALRNVIDNRIEVRI